MATRRIGRKTEQPHRFFAEGRSRYSFLPKPSFIAFFHRARVASAASLMSFRLLQFNMQYAQGWDDANPDAAVFDLDATIAEILKYDADIVFLQEVEQAQPGGKQSQPPPNYRRLQAALPGYDSVFGYPRADERELPFGLGLAIFSKTPLRDLIKHNLPSPHIEFDFYGEKKTPTDRVLISARTEINGHELTLLNTHLLALFMLKSSSEIHGEQRRLVGELLRAARESTLLAGDFNVSQPDSLIAEYRQFGFETVQSTEITWRRMPFVLDHIFYNEKLRCVAQQVIPTMTSDHHLLIGDFEFVD
jgi:endonuclease/exonuclease/phosphatase family metal-dependent hydrolase